MWEFFTPVATAGFWVAAGLLLWPTTRDGIFKYLSKKIDNKFDSELERLKSELRRSEDLIKNQMHTNDLRIAKILDFALSGNSGRQNMVDQRRLKAVERLWETKAKMDDGKHIGLLIDVFETAIANDGFDTTDKGFREFIDLLEKNSPQNQWKTENWSPSLEAERPFLSPTVYALYQAYQVLITTPMLKLIVLKYRPDKPLGADSFNSLLDVMKKAIPEYSTYIDDHKFKGSFHLLKIIEDRLLSATHDMLQGKAEDQANLDFASELLKAVETATKANAAVNLTSDMAK